MATGQYIGVASKKITLTNLVPAISSLSFAVGSSSGTCEMSTAHTKYGSTALCNTGVAGYKEMYALSSQKFQLIPDHFYYACVEVYQETKLGSIDYFWPSGSPSIFGGQATGNAGTWKKLSNVTTRTSFAAGEYPIRLDFNNGGTAGKAWYDGLMLIDLTEAFGAGNEPGNAWCQENIPYFTGTTTVERYTESGVARKVVSSYIGVEGVARKVTKGYIGVNGVARLWYQNGNVFITGYSGGTQYGYIEVDGVQYTGAATLEVPIGTVIKVTSVIALMKVYLNGAKVKAGSETTYEYTVTEKTVMIYMDFDSGGSSGIDYLDIYITEE